MLEHQTKCAGTVEKEYCAVKFAFRFPETVKQLPPQKLPPKDVDQHIIWCTSAKRTNKTRKVE
ncbi:hypothetical protein D4R42_04315 [bacterium]|nr:MAG: hypothetical protein D4R42_04315 [bacterium]